MLALGAVKKLETGGCTSHLRQALSGNLKLIRDARWLMQDAEAVFRHSDEQRAAYDCPQRHSR